MADDLDIGPTARSTSPTRPSATTSRTGAWTCWRPPERPPADYDPKSRKTRTVCDNLVFPNGVCLTHDGRHLLVASTWNCSILIFDLANLPAGPRVFVRGLPGYPDNINRASGGGYWIALAGMRNPVFDQAMKYPDLRRRMTRRVPPTNWLFGNLNIGGVLKIDGSGRIVDALWDAPDGPLYMITSMREHEGSSISAASQQQDRPACAERRRQDMERPRSYGEAGKPMLFGARKTRGSGMTLEGALAPNGRLDAAPAWRWSGRTRSALPATGGFSIPQRTASAGWTGGAARRKRGPRSTRRSPPCAPADGLVAAGLSGGGLAVLDPVAGRSTDGRPRRAQVGGRLPLHLRDEIVLVDCGYGRARTCLPWALGGGRARAGGRRFARLGGAPRCRRPALPDGDLRRGDGGILFVTELGRPASSICRPGAAIGLSGLSRTASQTAGGYVMACLARRDR